MNPHASFRDRKSSMKSWRSRSVAEVTSRGMPIESLFSIAVGNAETTTRASPSGWPVDSIRPPRAANQRLAKSVIVRSSSGRLASSRAASVSAPTTSSRNPKPRSRSATAAGSPIQSGLTDSSPFTGTWDDITSEAGRRGGGYSRGRSSAGARLVGPIPRRDDRKTLGADRPRRCRRGTSIRRRRSRFLK